MKVTKAYVINLRNVIKTFLFSLAAIIVIYIFFLEGIMSLTIKSIQNYTQRTENIITSFPVLSIIKKSESNSLNSGVILGMLLNENLEKPEKIFAKRIAAISGIKEKLSAVYTFINESNSYYIPKIVEKIFKEEEVLENVYPTVETTVASISKKDGFSKKGITIKNETKYSVNLEELFNEPLKLESAKEKPQVLIVHTHGTESYNPTDRSQDVNSNIVRVGKEMAEVFKEKGINVIHSEIMHDIPKFNNSYKKSLETINKILSENPSINIVLDIHRDGMIAENGDVYKVVSNINDKKASQVMFVVGTNQGGLSHDNWRENLKFAIKCQEQINKMHPNLARPINLRKERFNQHAALGSLIIEVGTNGNTLNESILSAREVAAAISEVINSL